MLSLSSEDYTTLSTRKCVIYPGNSGEVYKYWKVSSYIWCTYEFQTYPQRESCTQKSITAKAMSIIKFSSYIFSIVLLPSSKTKLTETSAWICFLLATALISTCGVPHEYTTLGYENALTVCTLESSVTPPTNVGLKSQTLHYMRT